MLKRIVTLLDATQRRRALMLLLAALVMAGLEVATIGGIAGFIAAVADSRLLETRRWIADLRAALGLADMRDFLFAAGVALFALFLLRNAFGFFLLWYRLKFLHGTRQALSARLLAFYLSRPYAYFLGVNSAGIIKNVTVEVNILITSCLFSWIMLISDVVMGGAILALLLLHDPVMTGIGALVVGALAAFVPGFTRRRLKPLGHRYRQLNEDLFKTTGEAVGGIKEIKVLGRESFFARRFEEIADEHARVTIKYMMITDGPRYFLEMMVIGGILVLMMLALATTSDYAAVAGTVALFAAAAYRMMPLGHRMMTSIAGLQFNSAILDALAEGLKPLPREALAPAPAPLPFADRIALRRVAFRYGGAARETLTDLSLEIACNDAVAFVGPTGVGKTTVVDLLTGLLAPTAGAIEIDGAALDDETRRRWQANIGYVPQQVFLLDDTIRRNIAVGVPDGEIDESALRRAAAMAHVDEFVAKLPEGYGTVIGERGVRLSGGQRQRIGIARALYRRAKLLVLDEATSSLDGIAESIIEDAIAELAGKVTVVIIAHRLTTVRRCNVIHLMEGGRIVASGSYEQLMRDNATFRAMARAAE
jgi:ABC-type multidrug transport system fused ATPase/permease subunit